MREMNSAQRYFHDLAENMARIDFRQLAGAVDALDEVRHAEGTVFVCGNGGSAASAMHFVCDLTKLISIVSGP